MRPSVCAVCLYCLYGAETDNWLSETFSSCGWMDTLRFCDEVSDGRWSRGGRMEVQPGGGTAMLSLLYAYSGMIGQCRVRCALCAVRCIFVKCMYTNTHKQGRLDL